jgi:hypothetical protein
MYVQIGWYVMFDGSQEGKKLLVTVTRLAVCEDGAALHIQRREQCRRAVTFIVVRDALHVPQSQRQHWLRALQGLHLTLLIHAKNQGIIGRVQIKPYHGTQLLDEQRIVGEFEALGSVRFDAKQGEVALHAALGDPALGGSGAYAPVGRAILGLLLERAPDQHSDLLIVDGARFTWAQLIVKTGNPVLQKALASLSNGRVVTIESLGDCVVVLACGTGENNTRPKTQRRRQRPRARKRGKLCAFRFTQNQLYLRSALRHRCISTSKDTSMVDAIYDTN